MNLLYLLFSAIEVSGAAWLAKKEVWFLSILFLVFAYIHSAKVFPKSNDLT